MALSEHLQDAQESLRAALTIQDRGLIGLGYRHGNFGRIGIECLYEALERLGVRRTQLEGVLGYEVTNL